MFDRLVSLIGLDSLEKIGSVNIALVGLGGVGGFTLEALIRCGVNKITIIDNDKIDISNLNRQIITNSDNIGKYKVDEATKRVKNIRKEVDIKKEYLRIDEDNVDILKNYDYIIDACDDINAKVAMIKLATKEKIKIICALGTGKRLSPEGIKITKLNKTCNDALARSLRQRLKKEGLDLNIPVVYHESLPLNNDKVIASSIFPPAVAGLYLAYYVINDIIK